MVGSWAYGGFAERHVDRWLSSRAGVQMYCATEHYLLNYLSLLVSAEAFRRVSGAL